ncbi:MAG: HEPN domain-containing protein [Pelolinea sp.]|nr:HEPN domain-containing protein [Pelolinea sp.]
MSEIIVNHDYVVVEFIWGNSSIRQNFSVIGSLKNEDPGWPLITITVPEIWAKSHSERINDFIVSITNEFVYRFNNGEINENRGIFEILHDYSIQQNKKVNISFHKDVISRFNKVGNDLLSLCQLGQLPSQQTVKSKSKFAECFSHGKLTNKNVGNIQIAMKDGFGAQIARYFNNSQVGLESENYKKFVEFCSSIHKVLNPKETISQKNIENQVFNWLEERFNKTCIQDLIEYLIPSLESQIKVYEVWIPIAELRVERVFPLGKIEIRPITSEWLNQWQEKCLSKIPPERLKQKIKYYEEKFTKPLQGWSAGVIKIHSDFETAELIALQETERSLELLRFFSIAALSPKVNSYVAIMGSENIEKNSSLIFINGEFRFFNQSVMDKTSLNSLSLNDEMLSGMNISGLNILSDLLRKDDLANFDKKILQSVSLFSDATREKKLANKLVYIFTSLENIFLKNHSERIIGNISKRIAIIIGKNPSERKEIIKNIKAIYKKRSDYIHHAEENIKVEELERFFYYAFIAVTSVVNRVGKYKTVGEFVSSIDDIKLSC